MTVAATFERNLRRLGKNLDVAFIPFVFDLLALVAIVVLVVTVGAEPTLSPDQAKAVRPNLVADLPEAMPTVTYAGDPVGILMDPATALPAHLAAVAVALMVTVPLRAYGTAGFVGLLYHRVHKGLGPQARSFYVYARRFYLPMLAFETAFTLLFLPGVYLLLVSPDGALLYAGAALAAFAILVFAPYAVVADGATVPQAVRRSVKTLGRRPAACAAAFAVALVATGAFAYLARGLIAAHGLWGYVAAGLLFSPLGAVLSLLFLTVYAVSRGSPLVPDAEVVGAA